MRCIGKKGTFSLFPTITILTGLPTGRVLGITQEPSICIRTHATVTLLRNAARAEGFWKTAVWPLPRFEV